MAVTGHYTVRPMSALLTNAVSVSDSPAPGDAELIERFIVARDQSAFAELVRRHSPVVLGVCRRVLHDAHDIDDVFQATFLVFVRDATRVRKRKSLASWLYGVAYRLSLRVARQKKRRRETCLVDDKSTDDDTFTKLADRHDQQMVDVELNALPERYRQPLVLRYLAGKTPSEIANELSITVGAVEGLLKRGKHELRNRLLQRGITTLGTALAAIQLTQQTVQAAGNEFLIESTIQAGLTWGSQPNIPTPDLISDRVLELAGKEIITMTTATKTAVAVGLTLGGLAMGLGGVNALVGLPGGKAEAGNVTTTISSARPARNSLDLTTMGTDPDESSITVETIDVDQADANRRQEELQPKHELAQVELDANLGGNDSKPKTGPRTKWDFKSRSPRVEKIELALQENTEVTFTDQPIRDAVDYLENVHNIEIWIDTEALKESEIAIDERVNLVMSGIPLKNALRLILDPLKLDYLIQDDVLKITSRSKADETFETRVYNTGLIPDSTPKELMELILATVDPEGWNLSSSLRSLVAPDPTPPKTGAATLKNRPADNHEASTNEVADGTSKSNSTGGPPMSGGGLDGGRFFGAAEAMGVIRATPKSLVIRQRQRIHDEIIELLEQLKGEGTEPAEKKRL